jgi:hypothetical protein
MISSYSVFYYGIEITPDNRFINFDEGSGELTAELAVGFYTPSQLAVEVQTKLNVVGNNSYTVSFNRSTRFLTIASGSSFDLLWDTGISVPSLATSVLGFEENDLTGEDSYTGTLPIGKAWFPQFRLQDYVPSSNFTKAADENVIKAANGRVVVVKYGNESFIEFSVPYITNLSMEIGSPIKNDSQGYQNALEFLNFAITKNLFEFMPDINNRVEFETVILESTPESNDGVGFKLEERLGDNLPGIYSTGLLRLRAIS